MNVLEKGLSVSDAFCEVDEIIKLAREDDTIYLVPDDNINSPLSFQAQIISARNHLVFHQRYIVSKATYINFNICGWVVKVRSDLAFKDTRSHFYICHKYQCVECTEFYMDQDSNYIPLTICICSGKNCKSMKDIYGETGIDKQLYSYTKEVIASSLDKLKNCNRLISGLLEDRSTAEICLNNLGILSVYSRLA